MVDGLRLYLRFVAVSLRGQLQYRASVIMQALGLLLITVIEFVGLWALFARFGHIGGWTLPQVALLYGMVDVAFALSEILVRGFDGFPSMVSSGEFDRLLVRPRSTVLQLLGQQVALHRLGRLVQGLAILIWAASVLPIDWSPAKLLLLLAAIAGGVCLFIGLSVVQATIAFWTVEPLEFMNAFTHGGVETGHYPLTVYRRWFRKLFTFVIPLACVNYLPALAILDAGGAGASSLAHWLSPLGGVVFLVAALQLWRLGVRKYVSTGS
jgi:ABC-2 type transport system permease protein